MSAHYVYRVYDRDGRLIYVGSTRNLFQRLRMHRYGYTAWWNAQAAKTVVKVFRSGAAARAAERAAIRPSGPQVRIRDYREALGLSVTQLVERIKETGYSEKLHSDTIRNVELGHKRASKPLMTAWIKALGLSPLDVWQPPSVNVGEQVSA